MEASPFKVQPKLQWLMQISVSDSAEQLCSNSIVNPSAVAATVPQPAASRRSINARRRAEQLMEALTGITCAPLTSAVQR